MSKILKINQTTGERLAGEVAFDEIEAGVLSGVIIADFNYNDLVLSSPVTAGIVPDGKTIHRCEVEVLTAFDSNVKITVGDPIGNASLMMIDEVELTVVARYATEPDLTQTADTTFKIYRSSGSPTVGTGRIKIYYQ